MDPKLKADWVAALRSGVHLQAKGKLVSTAPDRPPAFCCLGILELVAGQTVAEIEFTGLSTENLGCLERYYPNGDHFKRGEPRGIPYAMRGTLAHLNDTGTPFPEIANWIEANIPETSDAQV